LIDDSESNCRSWQLKGGTAFLFPQYWNIFKGPPQNMSSVLYMLDVLGDLVDRR